MFTPIPAYLALPRAPEVWLLEGLLPQSGLIQIFGRPKGGKSSLALEIAAGITGTASHVLHWPVRQHGAVAYLQLDTPRGLFIKQLIEPASAAGHDLARIAVADSEMVPYPFNIMSEGRGYLSNALSKMPDPPVLLIVDTLRECFAGDENSSETMRNVINTFVLATRSVKPAPAIMFLGHQVKGGMGRSSDLMTDGRGSTYVAGRMDTILKLTATHAHYQGRALQETKTKIRRTPCGFWELASDPDLDLLEAETLVHPDLSPSALAHHMLKVSKHGSLSTWRRRIDELG
jgi:RecA-family ATPase